MGDEGSDRPRAGGRGAAERPESVVRDRRPDLDLVVADGRAAPGGARALGDTGRGRALVSSTPEFRPLRAQAAGPQGLSADLARGLAAVPIDHYVIWNGAPLRGRAGSRCSRVLPLISQPWVPHSLRELALRAARLGPAGVRPEDVRDAVRQHQRALSASYLLVRKSVLGDYLAVTDVPTPAGSVGALREGQIVLSHTGDRLETAA